MSINLHRRIRDTLIFRMLRFYYNISWKSSTHIYIRCVVLLITRDIILWSKWRMSFMTSPNIWIWNTCHYFIKRWIYISGIITLSAFIHNLLLTICLTKIFLNVWWFIREKVLLIISYQLKIWWLLNFGRISRFYCDIFPGVHSSKMLLSLL